MKCYVLSSSIPGPDFVFPLALTELTKNFFLSSHCGLTVEVINWIIFLGDKLVGLLVHFNYRVADLSILILQLSAGKVLHNASPEWITQHVGGSTQAVPRGETMTIKIKLQWKCTDREHIFVYLLWKPSSQISKFDFIVCDFLHYASVTFVVVEPLKLYNDI